MKTYRSMIARTTFLLLVVISIITLALSSCSRDKSETKPKAEDTLLKKEEKGEEKQKEIRAGDAALEKIEKGDIGIINELSPELFVTITILYKSKSKKWLEESASLEPEAQKRYLDEASATFFDSYGITEEEYINYGKEHAADLDRYLEEHPDILSVLQNY
jgi:hypothetical protein